MEEVSSLPVARSVLYEVQKAQSTEGPFPVAPRSQLKGGVMICQPMDIVPVAESTRMPVTAPLYCVA